MKLIVNQLMDMCPILKRKKIKTQTRAESLLPHILRYYASPTQGIETYKTKHANILINIISLGIRSIWINSNGFKRKNKLIVEDAITK